MSGELRRYKHMSVLIVDDNPSNVALLAALLREAGLQQIHTETDARRVPRRLVGPVTTEVGGRLMSQLHYIETLPNGREHDILKISDDQPLDNTSEFVVPLRNYFVMGDNRDDSLDSRVPASAGGVGFVPEENLVGRVDLVLFSRDPDVASWDIPHWPGALRRRAP